MAFEWYPGTPPPSLEEHSKAKLDVLRSYIRRYYDRLGSAFNRDLFKLDVVDGFAGGGVFSYRDQTVSGTPLIMLEEEQKAILRLAETREKRLSFDVHHYFVDSNPRNIEYLHTTLRESGCLYAIGKEIDVICNRFEHVIDDLISSIAQRQPRSGRALFLLDQCGYSQVTLSLVHKIFERLKNAEVILTFAADALINFLRDTPEFSRSILPLGLNDEQLLDIMHWKKNHRAIAQRLLRDHVRTQCGASYDTPFFICPRISRRALWFIHLSRHPTARDVMMQCHWDHGNKFLHYGSGGLEFMGWDPILVRDTLDLFQFGDAEQSQLKKDLVLTLPDELMTLIGNESISVRKIRDQLSNRTAATYSHLDQVFTCLYNSGEIRILNAQGKERNKSLIHLRPDDMICMSRQLWLPMNGPKYS